MIENLEMPQKTPNHVYNVTLSFTGAMLSPMELTQRLNLRPSQAYDPALPARGKNRSRYWEYDGHDSEGYRLEWESLDHGLMFLTRCLLPVREEIIDLSRQFRGCWWCGHFQSSFDGGPTLSPALLTELAAFGLPLSIDCYFTED